MKNYSIVMGFVKLPSIDINSFVRTPLAGCKRCSGPLGDSTRRHCGPCILTALTRLKSLGV